MFGCLATRYAGWSDNWISQVGRPEGGNGWDERSFIVEIRERRADRTSTSPSEQPEQCSCTSSINPRVSRTSTNRDREQRHSRTHVSRRYFTPLDISVRSRDSEASSRRASAFRGARSSSNENCAPAETTREHSERLLAHYERRRERSAARRAAP